MPSPERFSRRTVLRLGLAAASYPFFQGEIGPAALTRRESDGLPERRVEIPGKYLLGRIATLTSSGKATIFDAASGRLQEIPVPMTGPYPRSITFSPSGDRIAIVYDQQRGPGNLTEQLSVATLGESNVQFNPIYESGKDFPFANIRWSSDKKWLAAGFSSYRDGEFALINARTGVAVTTRQFAAAGSFSPDSKWLLLARMDQNRDLSLLDLGTLDQLRLPSFGPSASTDWSHDGQHLAFTHDGSLYLYETKEKQIAAYGVADEVLGFSPGDQFLVYREGYLPQVKFAALNMATRGRVALASFIEPEFQSVLLSFRGPEDMILVAQSRSSLLVREINLRNRQITGSRTVDTPTRNSFLVGGLNELGPDWVISHANRSPSDMYLSSLTSGQSYPIEGGTRGLREPQDWRLAILSEDETVKTQGRFYILHQGKRHELPGEETASLVSPNKSPTFIPETEIQGVPEAEAIRFRPGDLLVDSRGQAWYLRNGHRYPIRDLDLFLANTKFNRQKWDRLPQGIIDLIPAAVEPPLTKQIILDWDGSAKEPQLDGGIMFLFISGFNTNSASHQETFRIVKERLKLAGVRETQFLDATYRVTEEVSRTGEKIIVPRWYTKEDTWISPEKNIDPMDRFITRAKLMFPRSVIKPFGHSLGGLLGLNAAARHPDAIGGVITIDSPLTRIDRAFWGELADFITSREVMGHEVGKYLTEAGHSLTNPQDVEARVKNLQRGDTTPVTTLHVLRDRMIPKESAILPYCNTQFGGYTIKTLWDLAPTAEDPLGHGLILKNRDVIDQTIVRIALN